MVKDTRATKGAGGIRALNVPTPVEVEEDEAHRPIGVTLRRRRARVSRVEEVWSIEDEWWRAAPVARMYYRVALESGDSITLFRDRADGRWYRQRT